MSYFLRVSVLFYAAALAADCLPPASSSSGSSCPCRTTREKQLFFVTEISLKVNFYEKNDMLIYLFPLSCHLVIARSEYFGRARRLLLRIVEDDCVGTWQASAWHIICGAGAILFSHYDTTEDLQEGFQL
jgi:hypothetical protein